MAEMIEEDQISDCEFGSDDSMDLFGDDPCFETEEELNSFIKSCNIQRRLNQDFEDNICIGQQKQIEKKCSCEMCENIWSGEFEHICCQQISK